HRVTLKEHVKNVLDSDGVTQAKYESGFVSTGAFDMFHDTKLISMLPKKHLYKIDTQSAVGSGTTFHDANSYFDHHNVADRAYYRQREWSAEGGIHGSAVVE